MSISKGVGAWGVAASLLLAAPAAAAEGDDDLALVRRAVASAEQSAPRQPAKAVERAAPSRDRRPATWLKLRVEGDGDDGASVSINLPLALVRATVDLACDDEDRERESALKGLLSDLVSGQSLVRLQGEEAEVRVWVE